MKDIHKQILKNHYKLYKSFAEITGLEIREFKNYSYINSKEIAWPNFIFDIRSEFNPNSINFIDEPPFLIAETFNNIGLCKNIESSTDIKKISSWPCLSVNINDISCERLNEELKCFLVENKYQAIEWCKIVKQQLKINFSADIVLKMASNSSYRIFIFFLDETPVATSLLFIDGQNAGIHMVATVQNHKRKGIGSSVFFYSLKHESVSKYKSAVCSATKSGYSPWLKMGFREYGSLDLYWKLGSGL